LAAASASFFGTWTARLFGFRAKPAPAAPRAQAIAALGRSPYGAASAVVWITYYYDSNGRVYWYDASGARRYVVPLSSTTFTYEVCRTGSRL
jgi:hypothetical protein